MILSNSSISRNDKEKMTNALTGCDNQTKDISIMNFFFLHLSYIYTRFFTIAIYQRAKGAPHTGYNIIYTIQTKGRYIIH